MLRWACRDRNSRIPGQRGPWRFQLAATRTTPFGAGAVTLGSARTGPCLRQRRARPLEAPESSAGATRGCGSIRGYLCLDRAARPPALARSTPEFPPEAAAHCSDLPWRPCHRPLSPRHRGGLLAACGGSNREWLEVFDRWSEPGTCEAERAQTRRPSNRMLYSSIPAAAIPSWGARIMTFSIAPGLDSNGTRRATMLTRGASIPSARRLRARPALSRPAEKPVLVRPTMVWNFVKGPEGQEPKPQAIRGV